MKKTYTIQIKETTTILVENNLIEQIDGILAEKNYSSFFLICDQTTKQLFGERVTKSLKKLGKPIEIHTLPNGEESKSVPQLFRILEHLIEKSFDRKSAVIALGGGVTGDIATTAAGLYHRGIDCIQIPTTLLSQVDAAIGGKGAVNLKHYKNIVGLIRQARFILIDPALLKHLPAKQITNGMGEVVKYAIALDKNLFVLLEKEKSLTQTLLPTIITRCMTNKMNIVQKDPYEKSGNRQLLNFGHTLGHAIELYAHLSHGEAISIGMAFAILVSQKLKMINDTDAKRAIALIKKYSLPTTISKKLITKKSIYDHMQKDKKAVNGIPTFVLLEALGKTKSGCRIPKNIIDETLEEICI